MRTDPKYTYPLTIAQLDSLGAYLNENHGLSCDGTLRLTEQWIEANGLLEHHDAIIWTLQNYGGYCDCEVMFNALNEPLYRQAMLAAKMQHMHEEGKEGAETCEK